MVGVVAAAALVAWYVERQGDAAGVDRSFTPVAAFDDVHALAVDPERPNVLYVATHGGLIRAVDDANWARVGAVRDDLMGFSVHPSNASVMWSSGHPPLGGNLGLRKSTDGGFSWTRIGLENVDCHAIAVSPVNPDHLWCDYSRRLYRSTDGGHAWRRVEEAVPAVTALAGGRESADTLYAAGSGGILRSDDGGARWTPLTTAPAAAVAQDPRDASTLYAATPRGVERSTDGGVTWTTLDLGEGVGQVGYVTVSPHDSRVVYAATYQTGIHKSEDGGESWRVVRAPS